LVDGKVPSAIRRRTVRSVRPKNKAFLRQFESDRLRAELLFLPERLVADVADETGPTDAIARRRRGPAIPVVVSMLPIILLCGAPIAETVKTVVRFGLAPSEVWSFILPQKVVMHRTLEADRRESRPPKGELRICTPRKRRAFCAGCGAIGLVAAGETGFPLSLLSDKML
jgi:hypothetical protein